MAVFNSSTFSTSNQYIKFRIRVTEISQNVVASTSRVKVQIQAWRTNQGYTTYGNGDAYLYVGANTYHESITTSDKISYNSYTTLLTKTIDVPRGEAGNAATRMYARWNIGSAVTTDLKEYTFNLTAINRYALLSSVEDFTDEGNPKISYINPAGSDIVSGLQARITWDDGESYTDYVDLNDEGGEYTFELSNADRTAMLNSCLNDTELRVTFDLKSTMNDTDYHDYKNAIMTVINAAPTFTVDASFLDANPDVASITGSTAQNPIIVQNESKLRIYHGTAVGVKGASIIGYDLNFNGEDYVFEDDYIDFDKPTLVGTYTAKVIVEDTRGFKSTFELTIVVNELANPTAVISWQRVNNFEPTTILNVDGKISDVSGNILSITAKYRKKETPAGQWTNVPSVQDAQDVTISNLDNEAEWEMEIVVSDSFNSATYTAEIGKGIPLMFFDTDKSSVGVNGFPDADRQFYVDGDLKVTGDIEAGGIHFRDRIKQVTLTQAVTIQTPDASGYIQLNDVLDFPDPNAVLICMQVRCSNIAATSGTIYSLVYWADGQRPYVMYQHAAVNFQNITHDFIFTFYVP